jgi:hypothetical protein
MIASGLQSKTIDNLFLGPLPKRIVVGFVDNTAFTGSLTTNPFNFQHFNLTFFNLYVDGKPVPSKPLQPDFNNDLYISAYHTLFSGTGIHFSNLGNHISRSDYPNGYTLFIFDVTQDGEAGATTHWNLQRHGSVRLEMQFGAALSSPITCLVYAEMASLMEIDQHRNIILDF